MTINGALFIGSDRRRPAPYFSALDPASGRSLPVEFATASAGDIDDACRLAGEAFRASRSVSRSTRAAFLEQIAENIMALGDELLQRAHLESGLPLARLTGERGRTVGQLRLFAEEVRDGAWLGIRIDPALPERDPLPRPDLRAIRLGLGPVAVFGASNFPLAFSVAGGDTASALAAGCPVVVKSHPAHPGTSELVAQAIASAVATCGLHEGTFSLVSGTGHEVGQALVSHPEIKAVGFTGSRTGGLALMNAAAARPVPIPVYAEMSAVNPVILLPGALDASADALGKAYAGSLSLGAGQFCTNPGLVFAIDDAALETFILSAAKAVEETPAQTMLTPGIHSAYVSGVERLGRTPGVERLAEGVAGQSACAASAALFSTELETLAQHEDLTEEVFGASSILVRCKDIDALEAALSCLDGQLTSCLHLVQSDHELAKRLIPVLESICGRIIVNGWPTGVEVCHAMVHGGPFPSTSDGRTTSVGTMAIERFLRPICYQNLPEDLLPDDLKGQGVQGPLKRVDGNWST